MPEENEDMQHLIQAPMSDIWRELLGNSPRKIEPLLPEDEAVLPLLESDPWSELLQSRDIKIISAQQLHLDISDQDVESALQVMQEDPAHNKSNEQ